MYCNNDCILGEKPYSCNMCPKAFAESCKLKRHLARVHNIMRDQSLLL